MTVDDRRRISRAERIVAALVAAVLLGLVLVEPDIIDAPIENARTMVFTGGGAALAAIAFVLMLRAGVHPAIRTAVLIVPFSAVSWWLLSPFFLDDVVDEDFAISIADAAAAPDDGPDPDSEDVGLGTNPTAAAPSLPSTADAPVPAGPVLLGAGPIVGLAGHEGTGDAAFFALADGRVALRLERFDIENGPDLRLYVVPGADRVDPGEGSLYLGELRGNVGDQTYDLPADFVLSPGPWTVLVWCEAFDVEFVAATLEVA